MTRKDYQAFAQAFALNRPLPGSPEFALWSGLVGRFILILGEKPNFNADRFFAACNGTPTTPTPTK